jgi:hypothetical protein
METTPQIKLTQPRGTTLINMGVGALIIAGLYFGREIFVPVALAVLLSFVLAPFVSRLQSLRLPRGFAGDGHRPTASAARAGWPAQNHLTIASTCLAMAVSSLV